MLGFGARYTKTVQQLESVARRDPQAVPPELTEQLAWAYVQAEMLRLHVCRRLSERADGIELGARGSIDKLLMTWVEQSVGHAALSAGASSALAGADDALLDTYLYSRAQSVMGGTSQIQKNIIATRVLGLPVR